MALQRAADLCRVAHGRQTMRSCWKRAWVLVASQDSILSPWQTKRGTIRVDAIGSTAAGEGDLIFIDALDSIFRFTLGSHFLRACGTMRTLLLLPAYLLSLPILLEGFTPLTCSFHSSKTSKRLTRTWSLNAAETLADREDPSSTTTTKELQDRLISFGASYNRGFGASPSARQKVDDLIRKIEARNEERYAARGITDGLQCRLTGAWRMVWTTALDVLSLEANPLATTGAIYQVFDPPVITNVIDFLPRFQSLLPPSLVPNSLLRANVETRAYERANQPNRVGLEFRAVRLQPVQALGFDVTNTLPPLGVNLPRLASLGQSENGPGYFDVTYLDDRLLIIRQQGDGLFCLLKVDTVDP